MRDPVDLASLWVRRELTPWQQQRRRYELGEWRAQHSGKLGNTARTCMRPLGANVTVHIGAGGTAHAAGVARCGSVWSCPVCAPQVRGDRAQDIEAAAEAWQAVGGEVWLITATVPHQATDALDDTLGRVQKWWSDAWNGKAGKGARDACGVVGSIRVLEVTFGRNGWHPHVHALWFCRPGEMDPVRVARRWRSRFDHAGIGDQYVPRVSLDVRQVKPGAIGEYLGKVNQEWGVGLEIARSDLKSRGGVTSAEILELASCGEAQWVYRWMEWERATKGRRCIVWSRGLRDLAISWQLDARAQGVELSSRALDLDERTDEEAAAGDDADQVVAMVVVPARVWNWWKRHGRLAEFLQRLVRSEGEDLGCHVIRPWVDPEWRPPDRSSPVTECSDRRGLREPVLTS